MSAPPPTIPLPARWKACVKSGFLHALSLAHAAIVNARGWCANSPIARVRLAAKVERLEAEVAMLREELRIKDCRLARIPPRERPYFPPAERLAILALKAARAWNATQLAECFLLTAATIANWHARLEESGPDALVQVPEPVNRFPEFVAAIVQRLKTVCPAMGKQRIANMLARAGLHLGSTTVRRMLTRPPAEPIAPAAASAPSGRTVIARYPHHVWNLDLTTVPIASGFWSTWFPFALPQCWPFCWWILVIVDHFSRAAIGFALFRKPPDSSQVCKALNRAIKRVGRAPKYTVSDQGVQFRDDYRQWCSRRGFKPRFGAVGRYGSVAVIERFIRTVKQEGTRSILVPMQFSEMRTELLRFFNWYNEVRPHTHLRGATPMESLLSRKPANRRPRIEPRARYPAASACAAPQVKARVVGCKLRLAVSEFEGAKHLPVVELRRAA